MKVKPLYIAAFVLWNIIALSVMYFIMNSSKKDALQAQKNYYETIIQTQSDSIALAVAHQKNTQGYADSLELVIEALPDSASFKQLQGKIDTLQGVIKANQSEQLGLIRQIRRLSKENSNLKKDVIDPKKILEQYLEEQGGTSYRNPNHIIDQNITNQESSPKPSTNEGIHIHIHNHTVPYPSQPSEQQAKPNPKEYTYYIDKGGY